MSLGCGRAGGTSGRMGNQEEERSEEDCELTGPVQVPPAQPPILVPS